MRAFGITLLLSFVSLSAATQNISTLMGARQVGMGSASATLADEWCMFNNIGAIGKAKQKSVGFAYEVAPTLVGANRMAAFANYSTKYFNSGISVFRFGDNLYSQQMLSVGIGNQVGITSLGAKVNYIQYSAEGFSTQSAFTIDFGGITQLSKQFSIGASITNITQTKLVEGSDRLPTRLTIGVGIKMTESVYLATELEKDIDFQTIWRTGIEYSIYKSIFVRTGYSFNPQAGSFGLGYNKNKFKFDFGLRFNSIIGATYQASATYLIPSIKK
jgi:hypothetical protein